MKVGVALIAALVALGLGALGMFGVNKLSSPAEPLALGSNAPSAHSASAPAPVVPDHVAKTTGADVANANPPSTTCDKPGAMGLSRTLQIDTTGGPQFGAQHFKGHDFLRDREVALTFSRTPAAAAAARSRYA